MQDPADQAPSRVGQQVSHYRLGSPLGRGGMGVVYQAVDQRLGRPVAVKHLRSKVLARAASRARFRREARALARLDHPVILRVFDFLEEPGGDWLVTELVRGESLAQRLRRVGPSSPDQVVRWGRALAEGLAVAHDHGLIHRDLKTENVMVTPEGEVKILDFGLVKEQASDPQALEPAAGLEPAAALGSTTEPPLDAPGRLLGTLRAMSPEQAQGQDVDHRSDLFSLGTLLYELGTGRSPFLDTTPLATVRRVVLHVPPSMHRVDPRHPEALSRLVEALHEKIPDLRPNSAHTVARRLGELATTVAEVPTAPAAPTAPAEPDPASKRDVMPQASPDSVSHGPGGTSSQRTRRAAWRRVGGTAVAVLLAISVGWVWRPWGGSEPASPVMTAREIGDRGTHSLEAARQLGEAALTEGEQTDQRRAILELEAALVETPERAVGWALLARLQLANWQRTLDGDDLTAAAEAAERANTLDPYLVDSRLALGQVRQAQGRRGEAARELETARALDPDNPWVRAALANLEESRP